jgi:plasmid stabilization system protein ParE
MPRLVLAPEARHDLRQIQDHIAKDNPKAARRVVTRSRGMVRMLAGAPAIGRDRAEPGAYTCAFVAGRHVLFDRPRRAGGSELVLGEKD